MSTGSRSGGSSSGRRTILPYPDDQVHAGAYLPQHPRHIHGVYGVNANHEEWIRADTMLPYSFPYPANSVFQNTRIASTSPWSPSALGSSFRGPSHSPLRILILDNIARDANQRPRRTIPAPMRVPTASQDDSILIHDREEEKDVLKKLRKEIYNPVPKKIIQRLNLYYRDTNSGNYTDKVTKDDDENDDKRCAICLEDFQPKEVVMVTPCSHMFHEDCIVPWVKSSGKCPVCRFAICERRIRERRSLPSNDNVAPADWTTSNDPFTGALISLIRAVDELPGRRRIY